MKQFLVLTTLLAFSFAAFSSSGEFSCEVRTSQGSKAISRKSFSVSELSGTNSKGIELDSVDEKNISISFEGYYAGSTIIQIKASSPDGSSSSVSGKAEDLIRLTSDQQGKYLDVLCRETIRE